MKVIIEVIPHGKQRYNTCGDWLFQEDDLYIWVSETGDWRMNYLIADHELKEAMLCKHVGVDQKQVDDYDKAHPEAGGDCFSDNLDAPYARYHNDALASEWQTARLLDVDWAEYTRRIEELTLLYAVKI
jgi:hypothetical protein